MENAKKIMGVVILTGGVYYGYKKHKGTFWSGVIAAAIVSWGIGILLKK